MKAFPILALALTTQAVSATPAPFTPAQTAEMRCIAALAIVAHDQTRADSDYADVQPLASRGAYFSEVSGQRIVRESGQSREAVRDAILAQVGAFQKAYPGNALLPAKEIDGCIALMDKVAPPPPPPSLVRCAALVSLAEGEMRQREGMTTLTSKLAVYAALLDNQAREQLRAQGKTTNESDAVIGTEKEAILAETKKHQAVGEDASQDFEACFALANPPKSEHQAMEHR